MVHDQQVARWHLDGLFERLGPVQTWSHGVLQVGANGQDFLEVSAVGVGGLPPGIVREVTHPYEHHVPQGQSGADCLTRCLIQTVGALLAVQTTDAD
jgi:hypothetical protein